MFWKKGQPPPSTKHAIRSSAVSDRDSQPEVEVLDLEAAQTRDAPSAEALETLAEVLRSLGRYAFDLDEVTREDTNDEFEKWAMKLLVGEVSSTRDGEPKPRGIKRDFGGLRRYVERHRKNEHDYVVTGMDNLRQAVRVFIQCTTGSFRAEQSFDTLISSELDLLGRALAINDHAQIRNAAERTAATVRDELEARRSREQRQIQALQSSMETLRGELLQMKKEARTDGLTRVFNRTALDEHILLVADQAFLSEAEACVVMLDIDHFKAINDNYGHQTGDEVLRQIADTIVRSFFRREDFVARYGGEEFCIICQHTTFETTRERAERLRQAVEKLTIHAFGRTIRISVSFGIALLQRGETAPDWLQRADEALYRAKLKGRNCISIAPLGEGEALGGTGAPLGATLSARPGDLQMRIRQSAVVAPNEHISNESGPLGRASSKTVERPPKNKNIKRAPLNEHSPQHARDPGKPGRKPAPIESSPIAALLGPSSNRR